MEVKGANEFIARLKNIKKDSYKKVGAIVEATARQIELDAVQAAPKIYKYGTGGSHATNNEIVGNISSIKTGQLEAEVIVNSKMAAYAEFGTGAYVDVPKGWEDIAWSYYVNGRGVMLPQPYLYPAWRKGIKQFKKDLEKYVNEESR